MNAGERASALAVETMRLWFASERLTEHVLSSRETIIKHITDAIVAADTKIKEEGKHDKNKEGMGTTIVLTWLLNDNVYVAWCGDSRVYRFNPSTGFEQLSHDHSYVQELVDSGKLSKELAFDHPNSNIITRSLGDPRQKVKPDVECFPIRKNDIILLCSDGLSGVLRDYELEAILAKNTDSMDKCKDALLSDGAKAGWDDNVTIALCQITSSDDKDVPDKPTNNGETKKSSKEQSYKVPFYILLFAVLLTGAAVGGYFGYKKFFDKYREPVEVDVWKSKYRIIEISNYSGIDSLERNDTVHINTIYEKQKPVVVGLIDSLLSEEVKSTLSGENIKLLEKIREAIEKPCISEEDKDEIIKLLNNKSDLEEKKQQPAASQQGGVFTTASSTVNEENIKPERTDSQAVEITTGEPSGSQDSLLTVISRTTDSTGIQVGLNQKEEEPDTTKK